jgi:proline iminopeptidase
MPTSALYPPIEPFESGWLEVGSSHKVYWEQSGNRDAIPVLFLHGGPGGGTLPVHRQFYNPDRYRIVLLDQRGCGRSTPLGETKDNTTAHLVADLEKLRQHLGIAEWLVTGGSWGCTLSLAYAQAHPERCLGLIVNGVSLGRSREDGWFLQGMSAIFPEVWRRFADFLPAEERDDLLKHYYRRLTDPDPKVHMPAAESWALYDMSFASLRPNQELLQKYATGPSALALARLTSHYLINRWFLRENALLDGINRIRHLPGIIVQARYDICTPLMEADTLARSWPEAEFVIVPVAGHTRLDPENQQALVAASERMWERLKTKRVAGSA